MKKYEKKEKHELERKHHKKEGSSLEFEILSILTLKLKNE